MKSSDRSSFLVASSAGKKVSMIDELLSLAGDFVLNLGDVAFVARAEPDAHHDRARVRWELIRGDESFAEGTDVLVVDDAGRVASVTTFLDRAPEGFDPHAHG